MIAVAVLWLAMCVLAQTPREREFCAFGTVLLMALAAWVAR